MELSASMGSTDVEEYGVEMCAWLVYCRRRAWILILRLRGTARFEMVLGFCTLVRNFASRVDTGSASRASAFSAHRH